MLGGLIAIVTARADRAPRLLLNTTASAPEGFYWVTPGRFAIGDLVAVRPPPPLARWMAKRGYLPANVPLLKVFAAGPGQQVCGTTEGLFIDGQWLARAKYSDRLGRPLPAYRGCKSIAVDEILIVNGRAPDSLDSRYFGPIPARGVIGRARPVLTWGARP
ncbi:S26 family signal peptidase [Caulobacter sp. UC70_42]|uniref:S26 family signal peptidase n=1 Tax=Caulobacter sp. UC70_42 TaxID=3374551 RepID=UPI00375677B6